jgi:hypothetical protein
MMSRASWPKWARVVTSPWLLSPVLVLALLAGAFVGYGAWTRSRPTHYNRGGPFASVGTLPLVPATSPRAGIVSPSAGPVARSAAPRGSAVATSSAAPTAAAVRSGNADNTATTASGSTTLPTPRAGSYALAVSGSEHVKFGPFSACTNTFPSSSQLVVSHASGESGASYDFDQRFYPATANKHDERHIYRYSRSGVVLTFEEATVTCGGVKQSTTVNYSPAQTRVRLPLAVGASWHSKGGDSSRTEDATASVVGTERVTVAGTSYLTYVIDTNVKMTGSETGNRAQRWWWSPTLAIPLKWHESLSGSRSGASYSEDVTCSVVALP